MGCPNCESVNVKQAKHTTGVGWGLFVIGGLLALPTLGVSLLLCLFAMFCTERRGRCRDCRWRWRC